MGYIIFISHGLHWRSIKVASFEYVIKTNIWYRHSVAKRNLEYNGGQTRTQGTL